MSYYRLESQTDIERIIANQSLNPSPVVYEFGKQNEYIYVYESNNPIEILENFSCSIANERCLQINDKLYVIELKINDKELEDDTTATKITSSNLNKWAGSKRIKGNVSILDITAIGECTVIKKINIVGCTGSFLIYSKSEKLEKIAL